MHLVDSHRQCSVAFSLRSVANYQRKSSKIFWAVQVINPSEEMVKNSFYSLNSLFDYYTVASSLASVGSKLLNAIQGHVIVCWLLWKRRCAVSSMCWTSPYICMHVSNPSSSFYYLCWYVLFMMFFLEDMVSVVLQAFFPFSPPQGAGCCWWSSSVLPGVGVRQV